MSESPPKAPHSPPDAFHRIGYACQHKSLSSGQKVTSGRTCRKSTALRGCVGSSDRPILSGEGLATVSRKTLENLLDIEVMLRYNVKHRIACLRISSFVPWCDYVDDFSKFPDWELIESSIGRIQDLVQQHELRITTHPGQYVCLGSPNPETRQRSITELESHGRQFDLLGLPSSCYSKINIHVGGTYGGDYAGTAERFAQSFSRLSHSVQSRLTVENDDRSSGWGVSHLSEILRPAIRKTALESGCNVVSPPIVFDSLHWELGPQESELDQDYSRCLDVCLGTWSELPCDPIRPVVHHSQSAKALGSASKSPRAHSDRYTKPFHNPSGHDIDIMLEAKDKELAAEGYIRDFLT